MFMIYVKRVYEPADEHDGARFLVDRLWPRGLKKEALRADTWTKAVSPSDALRHWFRHDPQKWKEFQRRYFAQLDNQPEAWQPLARAVRAGDITLLFSARDTEHNNALALRAYLTKKVPAKARGRQGKRVTP
jgi:uncharacterized protein YeaO (DUF488 family)